MTIDGGFDKVNSSTMSINKDHTASANDFTVMFLREQLNYLKDKVDKATHELEDKERLIQQIEREKRDYLRKYETLELANFELQEKMA